MHDAAFDSVGAVTELVLITSARIEEEFGRPLHSRLMAIVIAGGRGVKKIAIDSGDDLIAAMKTYDPPAVSVIGGLAEDEIVEDLNRAIAKFWNSAPTKGPL